MLRKVFDTVVIRPVYWITEQLNWRLSLIGDGPVWYPDRITWMTTLEQHWPVVLEEFETFRRNLSKLPGIEDLNKTNNANSFGDGVWEMLYLHLNGQRNEQIVQYFPKTVALMESTVPELFTVVFSRLGGDRKGITPHRDGHCQSIICHLPIIIPEGECSINIEGKRYPWVVGKCFTFEASALHYVQKDSDAERVVVLIDTFRPVPRWLHGISRAIYMYTTRKANIPHIFDLHEQAIRKAWIH